MNSDALLKVTKAKYHTQILGISPRRGRLCDLRRCTMTPIINAAPTSTTANTEKLVMAASFHTSGVSSTGLPVDETDRTWTETLKEMIPMCESIMAENDFHFQCLSRGLTRVARRGLRVLLAWCARHAHIQIGIPKFWTSTLTCTTTNIRDQFLVIMTLYNSQESNLSKPRPGGSKKTSRSKHFSWLVF